ncbi:MAG: secretin N-terminal domain-containing protein [Burkholderiales bacterium]|nr:secretin N-terminal domain-containing protein [Burkholderiales bacterium]
MHVDTRRKLIGFGRRYAAGIVLFMLVAGCANIRPYVPPSEGHIAAPQVQSEPEKAIPPPARVSSFVPPPKPAVKPQTYSVVVNEVPVKELLLALARDTRQNIDIHPGLQGLVSLNAIDETLPAILDRISKQVNLRYRVESGTIIVSPDAPYMKTYHVNYVNMTRNTTSTIGVSGQISASGAGASGSAAAAGSQTSASSTVVTTTLNNDFWALLRENIRAILTSTRNQSLTAEDRAQRAEALKAAREERLQQAEAVARAGQAATSLFTTAFGSGGQPQLPGDVSSDVIINPVSGSVSVLGTERQHLLIQQHLDSIANASQRQVLIEATIAEVTLSEGYQGGIDWSRLAVSGGIRFTQALLGGFGAAATAAGAAAGNAITIGYQNPNSPAGNISATIRLLQEFGNTRVLSSPKLMALNNQTALLKVVDNIVYFEVQAQTNTTQGVATTTFNTTPKTVSVGVVMGVTPQINGDGRVSLTVRPTISRVLRFVNDPNPSLANPCGPTAPCPAQAVASPVPEIQTREMESVLQVGSGQTVILGGLMQDDVRRNREQLPGADKLDEAG